MNTTDDSSRPAGGTRRQVRLLPGIIIVTLQWLLRFGLPAVFPGDMATQVGVLAGLAGGLAIVIWWAFFSRAPKMERWSAILLIIASLAIVSQFLHKSLATAAMGMMYIMMSVPVLSLAFVIWAVVTNRLTARVRFVSMVFTIILASGSWLLVRSEGMTGHFAFDFKWRWAPTQEEKFLSGVSEEAHALPETSDTSVTWPGFRGGDRDSKVTGVAISSDWKAKPPLELWRRTIGPGCSSFAVAGGRIYTQEQRGESEAVTCYSLETGKPVWIHTDKARFWDSHAGAGPRGTPAYDDGCVYTLGATGILNALNANDGSVIWSRNAVGDTGGKDTGWGICGSPIVCDSIVVVAASGNLAAYDRASGNPLWQGPGGTTGYSSPQLYKKGGRTQVVLLSDMGAIGVDPREGKILWEYKWESQDRILQPAITEEGDILICSATEGFRRIAPEFENGEWNVGERWTSMAMKPFFNDIVVHRGFVYGFDGLAVTCASLADGSRKWRAGRYGGQLILLADQDLLLLLSERGELVLVQANPEKYTELGRFRAIEGKTWNHPVLAGDILLVRNSVEMAAFRLKP